MMMVVECFGTLFRRLMVRMMVNCDMFYRKRVVMVSEVLHWMMVFGHSMIFGMDIMLMMLMVRMMLVLRFMMMNNMLFVLRFFMMLHVKLVIMFVDGDDFFFMRFLLITVAVIMMMDMLEEVRLVAVFRFMLIVAKIHSLQVKDMPVPGPDRLLVIMMGMDVK